MTFNHQVDGIRNKRIKRHGYAYETKNLGDDIIFLEVAKLACLPRVILSKNFVLIYLATKIPIHY